MDNNEEVCVHCGEVFSVLAIKAAGDDPYEFNDGYICSTPCMVAALEEKQESLTKQIKELKSEIAKEEEKITLNIPLYNVVQSDYLCRKLGINPWCINEGANGSEPVTVPLRLAKEIGLV